MSSIKTEEIMTTIGDLKDGDMVMCTDGKWRSVEILPIHTPDKMYEIWLSNGIVKCSGDHLWTIFDYSKQGFVATTNDIYHSKAIGSGYKIGSTKGPHIINIQEIEPIPSRCVSIIGSNDFLFEIITNQPIDIEDTKFNIERKTDC